MDFAIETLDAFGVVVPNIDIVDLSDEALGQLLLTLYEQRFVVLRTGGVTKADYVAFARRVGEPH